MKHVNQKMDELRLSLDRANDPYLEDHGFRDIKDAVYALAYVVQEMLKKLEAKP